jgi:hypothetical protein
MSCHYDLATDGVGGDIRCNKCMYIKFEQATSPTSGGRSVGIVRSRTQATEFVFFVVALFAVYFLSSVGRSVR